MNDRKHDAIRLILKLDDMRKLREADHGDECPVCQCGVVVYQPSGPFLPRRAECSECSITSTFGEPDEVKLTLKTRKQLEKALEVVQ